MTGIDLQKLEKLVNSELSSKILRSKIENNELLFETNSDDLIEVIQFLKSNDKCKFKQLIDIAAIDYPNEDKIRISIFTLSIESNLESKSPSNLKVMRKYHQ